MNDIVTPLTPDGMCGWDKFGQLCLWKREGENRTGTLIGDVRGRTCRICNQGWVLTVDSLGDQQYWRSYEEWVHHSCSIRYSSLKERDRWFLNLIDAKIRFEGLEEIPNGYWPRAYLDAQRPWYRVKLLDSDRTLKLGSRKRVYHMEIEPGKDPLPTEVAKDLFQNENVTKEISENAIFIHAWGEDKAREYLKAFSRILGLKQPHESVKR